jgi:transposase
VAALWLSLEAPKEALMLHVGLDLSRKRVDVCVFDGEGGVRCRLVVPPDADGLRQLGARFDGERVRAVIESMTGARFVHDTLEACGWVVEIADAQRVKALAPLTAKTDKIDARVLADLSLRDLIPAIWLPPLGVRGDRELARFRLHLVGHRTALKNRVHSSLITWGIGVPVSDLFGVSGRQLLGRLELPQAWRETTAATLETIDHLDAQIGEAERQLRHAGGDNPDVALLQTAPGIGPVLGFSIATEIGDIGRFPTPKHLVGYSGLCPRVYQSGDSDWRGPLTKHGPRWLRWALIEATIWACQHPAYQQRYQTIARRLGRQRGPKVARVDCARQLTTAIWWMLTRHEAFNPAGPTPHLVA